jgi:maltose/moltooligosaccharide transporter
MNQLKLNYRNTLFIGFGFFSILMLWQIYNAYAPIFLARLLSESGVVNSDDAPLVGFIMALDNFFALFMLPIFGILSDKTKTKYGRRIPYIILGMLTAAILFPFIAVMYIINSLVGVIITMLLILIVMNIYRNPAVSLMPDVTPKPLRSKANGIINLIGYVGAIIGGVLVMVFGSDASDSFSTVLPFIIVSVVMLVAMVVLFLKVKENKLVEESKSDMELGENLSTTIEKIEENKPLSKFDKTNMFIILIAVFFWFAAFNSIETFMSTYSEEVLNNFNISGTITIVLVLSSMITFIPAGYLALRLGRKFSVIMGLGLMILGLGLAQTIHAVTPLFFLAIAIIGIGWAFINVNSYPMMVEMSHKNNVGKYTGYYYTSSMLAQSFTPIVAGWFISLVGNYNVLFPYALVLTAIAFVVFFFVKERKNAVKEIKTGLEAFDVD